MSKVKSTSAKSFAAASLKGASVSYPGQDNTRVTAQIARTWTPKSLSGLRVWLDSADASTVNIVSSTTNSVSKWLDKSGNGIHAYQNNVSNSPTYSGKQNGLPGIALNGTSQWLQVNDFIGAGTTTIMIFKPLSGGTQRQEIISTRTSGAVTFASNVNYFFQISRDTQTVNMDTSASSRVWIDGIERNASYYNNSSTGLSAPNNIACALVVELSDVLSKHGRKSVLLGRANATVVNWYMSGEIYEIIICDEKLSEDERLRLDGYISNKWGISLPSNHPYKIIPEESSYLYSSLDIDTRKFYDNLKATGGQIRPDSLKYVDTFVRELKANKLWDKINDMGVFVGNTYQAAMTKLKYVGSPYLTPYNVTDSAYAERGAAAGIKGNGSSIYLDSRHTARSEECYDEHICAYTKGLEPDTGTNRSIAGFWTVSPYDSGTAMGWQIGGTWECGGFFTGDPNSFSPKSNTTKLDGCLLLTETGTTTSYYKDGRLYGSPTTKTQTYVYPRVYYILAINHASGVNSFSYRYMRFYSFGKGLSSTEAALFSSSINKLQASLNRL